MAYLPDALPRYAELHCLSNFSFLRGASHPEELVERAAALGYSALALTDECSFAGMVRAHVAAKERRLKLIVGTEILLGKAKIVLLAPDRKAYGAISALITTGRRRSKKGKYSLGRDDLAALPGAGVLALLASAAEEEAAWLRALFGTNAWLAAELHCGPNDRLQLEKLKSISGKSGLRLVAAGDVHMHVRSRRRLQDVLTATRLGKPVAACGHALFPNAERHLRLRMRLAQVYPPALLEETVAIAERCAFSMDELRYEYPEELVPPDETPATWLRQLTEQGLHRRYPAGIPAEVTKMIGHELAIIAELKYEPFFLTVSDVVGFARKAGILCQGRGSAANSAVCYALGITEVAPKEGHALFERFVSRERNEPPDIDVDFEHERREEVIQYIYRKYGRDRAALAATVICYRTRSAVRDVGKALGVPEEEVAGIAKRVLHFDRLETTGTFLALADTLRGFPRHLSQHVGGFVISRGPLAELVPVENAAMPDRTVIQWEKDDLEALGLLKVDVLALGMLTAIRKALAFLGMTMQEVPLEDPSTYAMVQKADTVGVFQIESRAQMSMLPRLRPANFYDLVIEVAIVRPGPIQGGMVHPYLKNRKMDPEKIIYPSEAVKGVLKRTLGVPIFQEQVMQLAMVAAGFTPGEADRLRRAMAAWKRKGGLEPFEKKLKDGMRANGYAAEFADALFRQILGFGEYGFPESHSASFAWLAYVSAWLKCHRPAAFCAALLNSQPMGFYAPAQLVQDARRHGVEVRPPDVNKSEWDCTLEDGAASPPSLRLGLRMVGGLSEAAGKQVAAGRPYRAVQDLSEINRKDLRALADAGALHALAGHRHLSHWAAAWVERLPLLAARGAERLPALAAPTEGQDILADYASLGLTLGRHPLALLRKRLEKMKLADADRLRQFAHGRPARTAGLVTCRQRPDTASGVVFVTLEDETGCTNVVVWRDLVERQRRELLGARLLGVQGVIERDGDVVHLVARRLFDHSELLGPLAAASRDFH
jgi:error-prone DNA polymerase